MNKGYIIYLPEFKDSVEMAERALNSATLHGWNTELYVGVNGLKESLSDYNIFASHITKKGRRLLQRPGTTGCFLSQYKLWNHCVSINEPICIFEHDVIFQKPIGTFQNCDVYKFEGFQKAKPISVGNWYEGARAYRITPAGAKKIISWVKEFGAMPADWMLNDGIVEIQFDKYNKVTYKTNVSFTKDLK